MTALAKSQLFFIGNFWQSYWKAVGALDVLSISKRISSWVMVHWICFLDRVFWAGTYSSSWEMWLGMGRFNDSSTASVGHSTINCGSISCSGVVLSTLGCGTATLGCGYLLQVLMLLFLGCLTATSCAFFSEKHLKHLPIVLMIPFVQNRYSWIWRLLHMLVFWRLLQLYLLA